MAEENRDLIEKVSKYITKNNNISEEREEENSASKSSIKILQQKKDLTDRMALAARKILFSEKDSLKESIQEAKTYKYLLSQQKDAFSKIVVLDKERKYLLDKMKKDQQNNNLKSVIEDKKRILRLNEQFDLLGDINSIEVQRIELLTKRNNLEDSFSKKKSKTLEDEVEYNNTLSKVNLDIADNYKMSVRQSKIAEEMNKNSTIGKEEAANIVDENLKSLENYKGITSRIQDLKSSMKGKVATAVSFGSAWVTLSHAFSNLSSDTDEVVNSMYRRGEAIQSTMHGLSSAPYIAKTVVQLNGIQSSLRGTAAAMNLPVEEVEKMTDSIMEQFRVYKQGKFDIKAVKDIGESAMSYARLTNGSISDSMGLMSLLFNKYGYSNLTKGAVSGMSDLDDQINAVTASVVEANKQMKQTIGSNDNVIYIEDMAKMMQEAASSADTYNLSLKDLAHNSSQAFMRSANQGAVYEEQKAASQQMTNYLLNNKSAYLNNKVGSNIASIIRSKYSKEIASKDVESLTNAISSDKSLGITGLNASEVARGVINNNGWSNTMIGEEAGMTSAGINSKLSLLQAELEKAHRSAPGGELTPTQQLQIAQKLGIGDMNDKEVRSFMESASKTVESGGSLLTSTNTNSYQNALKKVSAESVKKNAPITMTSIKGVIDSAIHSPLLQLIAGVGSIGAATVINQRQIILYLRDITGRNHGIFSWFNKNGRMKGLGKSIFAKIGRNKGKSLLIGGGLAALATSQIGNIFSGNSESDNSGIGSSALTGLGIAGALAAAGGSLGGLFGKKAETIPEGAEEVKENIPVLATNIEKKIPEKAEATEISKLEKATASSISPMSRKLAKIRASEIVKANPELKGSQVELERSLHLGKKIGGLTSLAKSPMLSFAGSTGSKLFSKMAGRGVGAALGGIPLAGGLIDGVIQGALTQGSLGRKIAVGASEGLLGMIPGIGPLLGLAADSGINNAYSSIFGDSDLTGNVGNEPEESASAPSDTSNNLIPNQNNSGGVISNRLGIPANVSIFGNRVMLSIPMNQMIALTQGLTQHVSAFENGRSLV